MKNRPILVLAALAASACATAPRDSDKVDTTRAALDSTPSRRAIAWGDGPTDVGLRRGGLAGTERLAMGVPAIAVGPKGEVLVLDALHRRVVRLQAEGDLVAVAHVELDAHDLAVGPDGAIAVSRAMSTRIAVFDPSGRPAGEVDASIVRDVDTLTLGPSRRVSVRNPFQDTFLLGSPSFPLPAPAVLHSKREGAGFLPDRAGLRVTKNDDGSIDLLVSARAGDDRSAVVARHRVGSGSAARIVGTVGTVSCMRVEHAAAAVTGEIEVSREAVCVDAANGEIVLRVELPPPGIYTPRRELAMGGSPAKLVFAHAEEEGLVVSTWALGGAK